MASRPASKSSAQKKLVTYGTRVGSNKFQAAPNSSHAASSLYDLPDSDDSASSNPHSNTISKAKPSSHHSHANPKSATPDRSSTKRKADYPRKRKHGNAFGTDLAARQSAPIASQLNRSPSPSTAPRRTPTPKNETPNTSETTLIRSSSSQASSFKRQPRPALQTMASEPIVTSIEKVARPRKSRLIDRLAAQKPESSGSDSDSDPDSDSGANASEDDANRIHMPHPQTPIKQHSALLEREIWSRPTCNQIGASASKKVQQTYSQARSIRGDTQPPNDPFGLSDDLQDDPLMSSPLVKPSLDDEFGLEDEDEEPKIAIKSVHELRRAGANNRFADEMEDLLSRIGPPVRTVSSLRRNALLELAQKLHQGDFASQFRDHSARDSIAENIGDEEDVVSGFAMAASLVIFLSSHSAPHLLRRLVEENVGRLLGRLLRISEDVDVIARQRTSNLSRSSRAAVSSIKASLIRLDIWHGYEPKTLSPCSLALQLYHLLQRNLETRYRRDLSRDMEENFANIIRTQAQQRSADDIDFLLVVLTMESESGADASILGQDQISRRASDGARILQRTLDEWPGRRGELESATLRLAINTTNTEIGAEAFGHGVLLTNIARCISIGLHQAQEAVENRNLEATMYDGLLLILGVMINILEHFPPARGALDADALERMAGLFFENRNSVDDTDSEDKSKVSVAFGYLAVILGYLCLDERGRKAMERRKQGSGVGDLIDSIREFIGLYRTVDSKVHELEGLAQDLRRCNR